MCVGIASSYAGVRVECLIIWVCDELKLPCWHNPGLLCIFNLPSKDVAIHEGLVTCMENR